MMCSQVFHSMGMGIGTPTSSQMGTEYLSVRMLDRIADILPPAVGWTFPRELISTATPF